MDQPAPRPTAVRARAGRTGIPTSRSGDKLSIGESSTAVNAAMRTKGQRVPGAVVGKVAVGVEFQPPRMALRDVSNVNVDPVKQHGAQPGAGYTKPPLHTRTASNSQTNGQIPLKAKASSSSINGVARREVRDAKVRTSATGGMLPGSGSIPDGLAAIAAGYHGQVAQPRVSAAVAQPRRVRGNTVSGVSVPGESKTNVYADEETMECDENDGPSRAHRRTASGRSTATSSRVPARNTFDNAAQRKAVRAVKSVNSMDVDGETARRQRMRSATIDPELEDLAEAVASDTEDDAMVEEAVPNYHDLAEGGYVRHGTRREAADEDMSDIDSSSGEGSSHQRSSKLEDGAWLDSEKLSPGPESVTSAEESDSFEFNIDPEGLVSLPSDLEHAARLKVAHISERFDEYVLKPQAARAAAERAAAAASGQIPPDVAAHDDELALMGLDPDEVRDTSMVAEYAQEIFAYMSRCERETMANPNYMDFQTEIQWHMRATLVDWLLQVHMRYHMLPETLWIAINVVDRFLSVRVVSLVKLQLVGVTAMFIAAKYEEILAPSVDEFVFMTEDGYSKDEILKGERIILSTLDFNVSTYCSPYSWVRRISKADDYDIQTRTLCKFLIEVTLLDHRFLRARPSLIAAVGMFLSKKMLGGEWNDAFVYYSGFIEEQLVPGANLLLERLLEQSFEEQFVAQKYAHKKFLKASIFARDWARRNHSALVAAAAAAATAEQQQYHHRYAQ